MNMSYSFSFLALLLLLIAAHSSPVETSKKISAEQLTNITKHLSFPDFNPNINPRIQHDLKLLGDAKLLQQQGIIQIPDQHLKFKAGRAIFSSPVRLLDPYSKTPASFSTTFSFQITTTANNSNSSSSSSDHGGSGLTFIAVPDELTVGRPGPWLGMMNDACDDDYKAFAVEFDTRHNPEFGDPNNNHVGINLGSIVSATTVNASDVGVSFNDGSVHRAWISYDGRRRWIDIRVGRDSGDFPSRPLLSAPLDLSTHLNEYMFVGFSASTGHLPQIHSIRSWNFSSQVEARLRLPTSEACEEKLLIGSQSSKPAKTKAPSAFLIFMAVVVLCLVVFLNFYCYSKRSPNTVSLPDKKQRPHPPNKPRLFSITEISTATRSFSEAEVLGSDERGIFYRGSLPNGTHGALKRFSTRFLNSPGVDRRRVLKEIGELSRIRHPKLVSIRGWCCEKREVVVVYDYLQNGSLDKWLFAGGVLPWTRRVKFMKDVAEALCFLHGKKVAHKNVKTSSILLDVSFGAVLGDFGFGSNWVERELDQKKDVYEFGMVVLEIVSGRRRNMSEMLLDLCWRMHEGGEIEKVVDGRMRGFFDKEQAIRFLEMGLLCTMTELKTQPSMDDVVGFINSETELPELPPSRPRDGCGSS